MRHKKCLYVLVPLLAARWIRAVLDDINALLAVKMRAGESATGPRRTGLHAFIEAELADAMAHAPGPARPGPARPGPAPKADARELDRYLHDVVLHFDSTT